jgi:hypothetical protein
MKHKLRTESAIIDVIPLHTFCNGIAGICYLSKLKVTY